MKARVFTFWLGVVAVGVATAWTCRHFGLLDLGLAILQYLGTLAAFINAAAWQVARQADAVPTKGLTPAGAERLRGIYGHRRRAFRQRWWSAVASGVLVGLIGTLLKNKVPPAVEPWLFYGGFVALAISVTLGVVIAVEYNRLADLARELPVQLDNERRKRELRQRLRRAEVTVTPSAGEVDNGEPAVR